MVIATRSGRIRRILERILRRLPQKDRLAIEAFVGRVRCGRAWGTYAFGSMVDGRAAALFPRAPTARGAERQAELVLYLPVCRLFSDKALTGIVAHGLAHAVRAVSLGEGWWRLLGDRWKQEERKADLLAMRWGFAPELHASAQEQVRVVLPRIEESERHIVTSIARRISSRS